jgi:hypothetical protein
LRIYREAAGKNANQYSSEVLTGSEWRGRALVRRIAAAERGLDVGKTSSPGRRGEDVFLDTAFYWTRRLKTSEGIVFHVLGTRFRAALLAAIGALQVNRISVDYFPCFQIGNLDARFLGRTPVQG